MTRALAAIVAFAPLAACAGADPVADCKSYAAIVCQQFFACATKSQIADKKYKDESDCEAIADTTFACDEAASSPCPNGGNYDSVAAQKCVDDIAALSCGDVRANKVPASCATQAKCH